MINCPVDGRQNITSSVCPQCKTDLGPLIYIRELPEQLYLKGSEYLTERKYDEAIKEFINAISIDPDNVKYKIGLGKAYLLKGLLNDALSCALNALKIEPGNNEAILLSDECNSKINNELSLKKRLADRRKMLMILLITVPIITLIIGFSIKNVLTRISETPPNYQMITENVLTNVVASYNQKELPVSVAHNDSIYTLSGSVPTKLYSVLAEEILKNYLLRDNLTKNEKIVNSILIRPDQLFIRYVIKDKDNLTELSKFFLGSVSKWQTLLKYNEGLSNRPDKLKVGESLLIPVNVSK